MPSTQLTIAVAPSMANAIQDAVAAGEYASSEDVVQDALLHWQQERTEKADGLHRLRTLWDEARADNSEGLEPNAVFDELEKRFSLKTGPSTAHP